MNKVFLLLAILLAIITTACSISNQELIQQLEEANQRIQQQQEEINSLKSELLTLKQPSGETQFDLKVDLTQWTEDEIIKAFTIHNKDFEDALWFKYEYRDDGVYYDVYGEIFPVDPFYDIVYNKKSRELTVNKVRIFNLDPGLKEIGDDKFSRYLNEINKKLIINSDITCKTSKECRGTTLVTCQSQGSTMYTWYSYPYLFASQDDNGQTLNTFKKFYCET